MDIQHWSIRCSWLAVTVVVLATLLSSSGAKSVAFETEPEKDIDTLVERLQAQQQQQQQRQREAQENKINAAEPAPLGKHKLHRLLQKFQQKLTQGNQQNQPAEEYPYLGNQPAPGNQPIDTYQPVGSHDDGELEEPRYHSNQEMVGYQKEGEGQKSEESSEDFSEEEEANHEVKEPVIVHQHPSAPQHLKAPANNNLGSGDKVATMADVYFLAVVAGCSIAGVVGLIVAGVCWYRLQKNVKAASEAEYSSYGVTGPQQGERVVSPGDRKLAQSAQMYHYQHQKQQMLAMEKANGDMTKDDEGDSEEENEEGDYTVYECPGLAPTGEMEVKNPLFSDETPVTPSDSKEEKK